MLALQRLRPLLRRSSPLPPSRPHASRSSPSPPPPTPTPTPLPRAPAAGLGLAGGLLGACAGVGGAIFITPGLVRVYSLAQPSAAGTAVAAVVAVSTSAAASHAARSESGVAWDVAALVALPAMLTTPFGARLASRVSATALRRSLGAFLIALSPLMPARAYLGQQREDGDGSRVALVAGGGAIGFAAGMLGIGGGSLMTPMIAVLQPGMPVAVVLGTSFAAMLPPSVVAAAVYARLGLVAWDIVPALVGGAVVGAAIGSKAVLQVDEEVLRWGFGAVFLAMGVRIFRRPITGGRKAVAELRIGRQKGKGKY